METVQVEKVRKQFNSNPFSGLFRLPGAVTKVNIIARALDSPNYKGDIVDDFEPDNQALASVLKKFYRDLKFPVLQKVTAFFDSTVKGVHHDIFWSRIWLKTSLPTKKGR